MRASAALLRNILRSGGGIKSAARYRIAQGEAVRVYRWEPGRWSFLYAGNLDETAGGVTLFPGTTLAFTGGKVG